jgi:hypothetical protein|nr:MAG TPA: hypothetical protein [Caudoviricetes sp.]
MKFSNFAKALTNEYLMVVNNDQAEVLGAGNIENILNGSNFANIVAEATVLKLEKLSEEEAIEWDLEDKTASIYVVTLDM